MFKTVRQTAKHLGIFEHFIRALVAQGRCPGIYSGTRFLVHVDALREFLDEASKNSKGGVVK